MCFNRSNKISSEALYDKTGHHCRYSGSEMALDIKTPRKEKPRTLDETNFYIPRKW